MTPAREKLLVFFLFTISILFSIITLGLSFTQVTNDDLLVTKGSCSDARVPFKMIYIPNPKAVIICSWTVSTSFVRIFSQFIIIATVSALFFTYKKKNNRYFLYLTLLLGLISVFSSYSFFTDASSLIKSVPYCKEYMNFSNSNGDPDPTNTDCVFESFYGTLTFNIFTTLSIICATISAFKYRNSIFNSQNHNHQQEQQQSLLQNSYDNNQMNGFNNNNNNSNNNNNNNNNNYNNNNYNDNNNYNNYNNNQQNSYGNAI